jgi:hypothetical protein
VALHYPLRHAWEILVAQVLWGAVAARHGAGMAWLQGKIEGIRNASRIRRATTSPDRDVLEAFLTGNERLIQDVQKATGVDRYWRLYFLLTHLTK